MQVPRSAHPASVFLVLFLLMALVLTGVCLYPSPALAAGNHFKNSAPDPLAGPDDGLRAPADFEAAVAARPNADSQIFVSRCRFAPFSSSTSVYTTFVGTQTADAIVGDTTFSFADGTTCYNPQNESNIVINPTNPNNVVTSANEYRIDGDEVYVSNQGSQPVVAPDGTVYVAYEGSTPSTGFFGDAIIVARSTDGGKTFTNTEVARAYDDFNCYPINVAQGRQTLSGEQFRINSFPSLAIDPTTEQLAISWADDQANASCGFEKGSTFVGPTSNQVKLITSPDGTTWSAPQVITTGVEDKVYSAVGFNAGRLIVTYYTRAYSPTTDDCKAMQLDTTTLALSLIPGPVCLDYAARSSSDSFATETRLTTESSNPYITFAGSFIGDYTGAAVDANGKGFAAWADFRGNPGVTDPNMDMDVYRDY